MAGNKQNTSTRIYQAVVMVKFYAGNIAWVRVSRQTFGNLTNYYQSQRSDVHYVKIYEILNYKKGANHVLGNQIGYITKKGALLQPSGIQETQKSIEFKLKFKLTY